MSPPPPPSDDDLVIGPIGPVDLPEVATFVAEQQADPTRHIAYLGTEADGIAAELEGLEPRGLDVVLVARRGADLVGVLGADWSDEPPRVWWLGPFVASGAGFGVVADALLASGRALLPPEVTQEEIAVDGRNEVVAAFAARHGFVSEEASALLGSDLIAMGRGVDPGREQPGLDDQGRAADDHGRAADGVEVSPLAEASRAAVVALHDRVFPGTHTPGDRIDRAPNRVVLAAVRDDAVLGYVAVERQEDGDGSLDFLGVAEGARGQGIGRRLVVAGCQRLRDDLGCSSVHLTVRASNVAARRLYASIGFVEERLLHPWSLGFRLD